jgi:hypothetical protein
MDKKERIKRFIADKMTSDFVRESLRESFLKSRGNRDVYILAAERIAIELLDDGFRDMERIAHDDKGEVKEPSQIGV